MKESTATALVAQYTPPRPQRLESAGPCTTHGYTGQLEVRHERQFGKVYAACPECERRVLEVRQLRDIVARLKQEIVNVRAPSSRVRGRPSREQLRERDAQIVQRWRRPAFHRPRSAGISESPARESVRPSQPAVCPAIGIGRSLGRARSQMARIRSSPPDVATDPKLIACSLPARLLGLLSWPVHLRVVRGRVTAHLEYFRVGSQKLSTVRRVRRTGALSCLTHRGGACDHIEAVLKHLQRGRIFRPSESGR